MKWKIALLLVVSHSLINCSSRETTSGTYDLWIKNGYVVDGTGSKAFEADVLVRSDTIAFVGKPEGKPKAAVEIDATDLVVAPGFIDAHAHGDPIKNSMENFLRMGVTTVALGQDGFHPNNDTMNLHQWMKMVDERDSEVNVAMFVGHSMLRKNAKVGIRGIPDQDQLQQMGEELTMYLQEGCFGLTTGLEYASAMNTKAFELNYLAEILGKAGGLMMSHIRNEDDGQVDKGIDELIQLGSYGPVHVSHMKIVYGNGESRAKGILAKLDSARESGIMVTADVYPYLASYTTIGILFPEWCKTQSQFQEVQSTRLQELRQYLFNRIMKRNGPDATLFAGNKYAGKTLKTVAEENGVSFVDILLELGPEGGSGAYFIMEDSLMSTLLEYPHVMLSSDGSPTMRHPRGYGAFSKFLRVYYKDRSSFDLEEAVRKMTSLTAETIGLPNRGRVSSGFKADLLLFNPLEVEDRATYENPYQFAEGMRYVIVNGEMIIDDGNFLNSRAGKLLRKSYN